MTPMMTRVEAALPLVRIIARRVPWPSLKDRPERSGLRLRWDTLREDTGELLVAGTEHPMAEACRVLTMRGVSGATPATMRHAGSPHDSFNPASLRVWAARGEKLAQKRAEAATLRERTAGDPAPVVQTAEPIDRNPVGGQSEQLVPATIVAPAAQRDGQIVPGQP